MGTLMRWLHHPINSVKQHGMRPHGGSTVCRASALSHPVSPLFKTFQTTSPNQAAQERHLLTQAPASPPGHPNSGHATRLRQPLLLTLCKVAEVQTQRMPEPRQTCVQKGRVDWGLQPNPVEKAGP